MARLWPLLFGCAIVLGIVTWLCLLDRRVARLEGGSPQIEPPDLGLELDRLGTLARLLPRSLTRVAHFSGVALGFIALARALADQRSPFVGLGCLVLGFVSALAFGAWGRRFQGRVRALRSRAEKNRPGGKVLEGRPFP